MWEAWDDVIVTNRSIIGPIHIDRAQMRYTQRTLSECYC
jgi:hypothetical protein